jgi:hypothetical protein
MVELARMALKGKRLADIPVLRMDERGRRKAVEHVDEGRRFAGAEPFVQWQNEVDRFFSERG